MVPNAIRILPHAILLAAATLYPQMAGAQAVLNCADRAKVIEFLAKQYSEKQAAVGMVNQQAVMELYAADSGTWTLVITDVSGRSCVILAGKSWETIIPVGPKA
ncbi:hypothetical protein [Sinorhizobium americanum]|uniref:Uncharacterized protein n=1 Tax=Sinorhizobium americanum TaxID=194963 RepID=A0A1L3LK40_9HYPH|nr:hypothetical protein [Sinorhizobium americanum]APG83911.1 hypothetical protein SAMCCGM7_Ch1138 [Sinorhizobium americanum CCGM7]APG90462.1 hypothetical protein SAMCFNEI73_Ch1147 [Sinorhizobium americanum]OAP37959.1 hypothetical protein ATC00_06480 [Sinorhizobium americanum]